MATAGGVAQAIFPEGGLSRDGYLQPVKLGLLNYIVSGFDPDGDRDVVFVPVGLNYDRVLEDRVLTATGQGQFKAGLLVKIWGFLRFVGRNAMLRILGRFRKFGYASVSFGAPISLTAFLEDKQDSSNENHTRALGKRLLHELGQVVPMLPVPLISLLFCKNENAIMDIATITDRTRELRDDLVANGGLYLFPQAFHEETIKNGLSQMVLRQLLVVKDGQYRANTAEPKLLRYYANSIAHLQGGQSGKLGGDSV
jgi:glycerol-3-phosphate O-acyltransferase